MDGWNLPAPTVGHYHGDIRRVIVKANALLTVLIVWIFYHGLRSQKAGQCVLFALPRY